MIEIDDLALQLGAGPDTFRLEASLRVPSGAICALTGPSGGGKSTLLAAIAGFLPLERGRILVEGRDIAGLAPEARPVSMLFQDHNLFPDLTAAQNVGLGLAPRLHLSAAERARVDAALAEVGLAGLGARREAELSGGQRQRVALARALLRDRPVLLLDEPFAALGPAQRAEMVALVGRILRPRGATALMATHDRADIADGSDFLAFCADGRIAGAEPTGPALAAPSVGLAAYLGRG